MVEQNDRRANTDLPIFFRACASAFITSEVSLASINMSGRAPLSRIEAGGKYCIVKTFLATLPVRPLPLGLLMFTLTPSLIKFCIEFWEKTREMGHLLCIVD